MKRKGNKDKRPKAVESAKRGAAAGANATRGRARRFKDKKKEDNKKACRNGTIDF